VRNILVLTCAVCVFSASAITGAAAQQVKPAAAGDISSTSIPDAAAMDDILKAVRGDLQSERADIIAKNVTLTSEVAAKFWPVYNAYQKEQNAIMDDQLRGLQRYIENYDTLDDAGALSLINAHFDRDGRMNALRQKWFGDFQKVLGTKQAVRVMQIDRRLSLAHQLYFATRLPLAH
jgi:hypothetical protein